MLWTILTYALVGALAGWLAGKIVKAKDGTFWVNMVIGVVGSYIGAFVTGKDSFTGLNLTSVLVATLGAVILLVVYKVLAKK